MSLAFPNNDFPLGLAEIEDNEVQQYIEEEADAEMDSGDVHFIDWCCDSSSPEMAQIISLLAKGGEQALADAHLIVERIRSDYRAYASAGADRGEVAGLIRADARNAYRLED